MRRLVVFGFLVFLIGVFNVNHIHANASLEIGSSDMNGLEEKLTENAKLGIRSVEFPKGLDWFNVSAPLQMERLKGKVVLLDFWTFCCINCMHVLPELARLEEKYAKELAVVGVHSAKFANERDSENIRQSILRYEVHHPVVNDPALTLWQAYGVSSWPTLVLINPKGHVVLMVSGEGHYDLLDRAVGTLVQQAESEGAPNRNPIEVALEEKGHVESDLKFPGKIFVDQKGLIISDSNHNRIIILDHSGAVLETIGSGIQGASDGNFSQAEFHHPQGVFREGDFIYVADTENHLIREINLKEKAVKTIAGTGVQGSYLSAKPNGGSAVLLGGHGKAVALKTPLNSPWDLVKIDNKLYIAMAGAHQIWSLDLKSGELDLFAGSGREGIIDGGATSSALAQPSGITFDGKHTLYFADSEVSAVRSVDLESREVKTLIGHGLFDFGDKDGAWPQALLQHPLGVNYADGKVYVADTYNDKIKVIDLNAKTIRTLAGSGKPDILYEPGGLNAFGGKLFIADTNHHAVRSFDLASGKLAAFEIKKGSESKTQKLNPFLQTTEYPSQTLSGNAQISVNVLLPRNHEFTQEEAVDFKIRFVEGTKIINLKEGRFTQPSRELPIVFNLNQKPGSSSILEIDLEVPYCTTVNPKLCKFKSLKLIQPISWAQGGKPKLELNPKIE